MEGGRARRVQLNEHGHHQQHYLLRAEAVTLTEGEIARMSDAEAYTALEAIRFAETEGVPCCPHDGCRTSNAYRMTIRRRLKTGVQEQVRYKCRACRRPFTITSGTLFAHRKMAIRDLLYAQMVFVNALSGEAALRMRRTVGLSYKAAFVLEGKLRESLALSRDQRPLEGVVEVDGTSIGGHSRKGVEKARGKETRVGEPSPERAIVVMRERRPDGITRVGVFRRESNYRDVATGRDFIRDNVVPGSIMVSDEGFQLGYIGPTRTVNHSKGFRIGGVHNNGAESFFARIKRAENGVHYRMTGGYVDLYAEEMSWREDNRRKPTGVQWRMLVSASASAPTSRRWKGYWQRWQASDPSIRRRTRQPLKRALPVPV